MAQPVIGVPASTALEPWYSPSFTLPSSYLRAIEMAGAIPLLIQPTSNQETLAALYTRCDGLLLAGGEDVHPSAYGAAPHPKLELTNPQRDAAELWLARRGLADGLPILGICRGLQLLNVAIGGTLYQDLDAEHPSHISHTFGEKRRDFRALSHSIEIDPDSWLAEVLETTKLAVNSLHHQAIRDLAPGLRAVALAPDGVIEAVEGPNTSFIVAVQSHPELVWEDTDPRWARLFQAFVQQCKVYSGK